MVLEDASVNVTRPLELKVHQPEEIAARIGGISIKTLTALIRNYHLETTTLGYTEPARRGGRPRRLWAMTDSQLDALLALRDRRDEKDSSI